MDKENLNRVSFGANRKQSYIIPKRGIVQRFPLIYLTGGTILGLAIFFSRPIYDAFFRKQEYSPALTPEQRRKAILDAWSI